MRIFITGATGLIGRRVVPDRLERGDHVVAVSRDASRANRLFASDADHDFEVIEGNPAIPGEWQKSINGCDAVIHLAGAGVVDKRWTAAYKKLLVDSRIDSTYQVVQAIEGADRRPDVLINASAVGYYGDSGDSPLDETAQSGNDFLANLAMQWEQQALRAQEHGVRVVMLRIAAVLDEGGGALAKMAPLFRFMLGGPFGSGRQYMPWIHWRDVVGLIDLALKDAQLSGPINVAAPEAVTSREFARIFGAVLRRPAWLRMPGFAMRIAIGELARYAIMSQRVRPAQAERRGYQFVHPELRGALESLLRPGPGGASTTTANPGNPASPMSVSTTAGSAATISHSAKPVVPPIAVRLLVIDVDGTLLRSDGRLSQGVIQACRAAVRAGCVVVLATARGPRMTNWITRTLGITAPTINYNGAVIWNPQQNTPLFHQTLSPQIAQRIVALARSTSPRIMVAVERLDRWYTDRIDPQFEQLAEPDAIGPLDAYLSAPVTRLTLLGALGEVEPVLGKIRESLWQSRDIALFHPDPQVIQITHPMADKAIALQRVASRMTATQEEVMVIGDAHNDLGMMEWAGFAVAVGNATEEVKQLADAVVPSNDDLGVARAIDRYVLARRPL
ncbi:MAG: TIGR01777 family oxidoreductase [Planctomycetota bacterium]|nr:TIGR01777 family oxidoreductase [Planctomycetota bacterium]